jgi:hypothetical protein
LEKCTGGSGQLRGRYFGKPLLPEASVNDIIVGPMTTPPIPADELKRGTWYFGARCIACARFLPLTKDLSAGKGLEQLLKLASELEVACECGNINRVTTLQKVKTP